METMHLGRILGLGAGIRFQKRHASALKDWARALLVDTLRVPLWLFGAHLPSPRPIIGTTTVTDGDPNSFRSSKKASSSVQMIPSLTISAADALAPETTEDSRDTDPAMPDNSKDCAAPVAALPRKGYHHAPVFVETSPAACRQDASTLDQGTQPSTANRQHANHALDDVSKTFALTSLVAPSSPAKDNVKTLSPAGLPSLPIPKLTQSHDPGAHDSSKNYRQPLSLFIPMLRH